MIKVGLTGNIGTGKSTVAKIFESLGIPIYHADLEAKRMLDRETVKEDLLACFGDSVFDKGSIDRNKLAKLVFSNPEKLKILNAIIHPLVKQDLADFFVQMNHHPYVIQEAAILFESGFYKDFDKTILVTSSIELANERVIKRDGVSLLEVQQRRGNQWTQEKKIKLADYIIGNDEQDLLIPQVLKIHQTLIP